MLIHKVPLHDVKVVVWWAASVNLIIGTHTHIHTQSYFPLRPQYVIHPNTIFIHLSDYGRVCTLFQQDV